MSGRGRRSTCATYVGALHYITETCWCSFRGYNLREIRQKGRQNKAARHSELLMYMQKNISANERDENKTFATAARSASSFLFSFF